MAQAMPAHLRCLMSFDGEVGARPARTQQRKVGLGILREKGYGVALIGGALLELRGTCKAPSLVTCRRQANALPISSIPNVLVRADLDGMVPVRRVQNRGVRRLSVAGHATKSVAAVRRKKRAGIAHQSPEIRGVAIAGAAPFSAAPNFAGTRRQHGRRVQSYEIAAWVDALPARSRACPLSAKSRSRHLPSAADQRSAGLR